MTPGERLDYILERIYRAKVNYKLNVKVWFSKRRQATKPYMTLGPKGAVILCEIKSGILITYWGRLARRKQPELDLKARVILPEGMLSEPTQQELRAWLRSTTN